MNSDQVKAAAELLKLFTADPRPYPEGISREKLGRE